MLKIYCSGNPLPIPGAETVSSPDWADCLVFFHPDPAESVRLAAEASRRPGRPALAVAAGAVTYAAWLEAAAAGVPVVAPSAVAEKASALVAEWAARRGADGTPEQDAADLEDGREDRPPVAGGPGAEERPGASAGGAGSGSAGAAPEDAGMVAPAGAAAGDIAADAVLQAVRPAVGPGRNAAAAPEGDAAAPPPEKEEDFFPRVRVEAPPRPAAVPAAPFPNVVGSFSPAGGVSKTFVATNVASWAAKLGVKTLLIDVDLGSGDAASALFLGEAAREAAHPTAATWRDWPDLEKSLLRAPWGLFVLPRPEDPAAEASLGAEEAADLLSWAAGAFGLVVVDFGVTANLPFTRAALERCGRVLLVVDPTTKSVAKVTSFLEGEAAETGMRGRSYLVVNRITPTSRYRAADLARIFGFPEYAAVPEDAKRANQAARKRVPLALLGEGRACREVRRVAEEVALAGVGVLTEAAVPASGGVGGKILGRWCRTRGPSLPGQNKR